MMNFGIFVIWTDELNLPKWFVNRRNTINFFSVSCILVKYILDIKRFNHHILFGEVIITQSISIITNMGQSCKYQI